MCGIGPSYVGKLLLFDGLQGKFTDIKLRGKQGNCAVCGTSPTITALLDNYAFLCGSSYDDKVKVISFCRKFWCIISTFTKRLWSFLGKGNNIDCRYWQVITVGVPEFVKYSAHADWCEGWAGIWVLLTSKYHPQFTIQWIWSQRTWDTGEASPRTQVRQSPRLSRYIIYQFYDSLMYKF